MENFEETTPQFEPQRRTGVWLFGAVLLVVLLGAAAFLAGRLMNRPETSTGGSMPGSGNRAILSRGVGGAASPARSVEFNLKPAPELPTVQADANGLFVERKDNSLFVGTGKVTVSVMKGEDGVEAAPDTSYDGDVVEVVVTQDTKIFRDATEMDIEKVEGEIQQKVEESNIEAIGSQSMISAWGKKVGDRIIADVLVFSQPFIMRKPGSK